MARKAVEQELSREKIIHVARQLFMTQGYDHVSMRMIGKELGYSHGALYYHFKNKAELFHAVIQEEFTILGRVLLDALHRPGMITQSRIEQIMLAFIRFGLEFPHQYEIMFMIRDREVQKYALTEQLRCYEQFAYVIGEAARQGHVKPEADICWQLFLSIHGFITHYIRNNQRYVEVQEKARDHVHFLCKALA